MARYRFFVVCCLFFAAVPAQQFAATPVPWPANVNARDVAIGDVNLDGVPDLVLASYTSLAVAVGDGLGGWAAPWVSPSLPFVNQPRLVDTNGDGLVDLWAASAFGPVGLQNDGAGGWVPGPSPGPGNNGILFVDLDADGAPDFVGNEGTSAVFVARNNGAGGFHPASMVTSTTWFQFGRLIAGDVNGDGHMDVVSIYQRAAIFLGDGTGTLTLQPNWIEPLVFGPYGGGLADFDGDHDLDLLVGGDIWRNDGSGGFTHASSIAGALWQLPVVVDIDGDGHVDIVAPGTDSVGIYHGLGNCSVGPRQSIATQPILGVAVADLDADGHMDIVTWRPTWELLVLRNTSPTPVTTGTLGTGTPACGGHIGIRASHAPVPGEAAFRIASTNVPTNAAGMLAMGVCAEAWDPLGLGLTLHLQYAMPLATMWSDGSGSASCGLPIPADQGLIGLYFCVQSIWMGDPGLGNTCSPAQFELASSPGLVLLF